MEKDPVCGMEVDPKTAVNKSNYQGKTYYFCSVEDKQAFDKEPQRYVKPQMQSGEQMHHHEYRSYDANLNLAYFQNGLLLQSSGHFIIRLNSQWCNRYNDHFAMCVSAVPLLTN